MSISGYMYLFKLFFHHLLEKFHILCLSENSFLRVFAPLASCHVAELKLNVSINMHIYSRWYMRASLTGELYNETK